MIKIVSLLLLVIVICSVEVMNNNGNDIFVTEIIVPFDMPMTDLSIAAKSQLSRNDFKTNSFSGQNITVNNLIYKSTYNDSQRTVNPPQQSPMHTVSKDALDLLVTYQANLHPKLPTRKTINASTTLKIYFNYTKEIDAVSGNTQIQNLTVFVDPSSFKLSYPSNLNSAQKKLLENVNNGNITGKNIWHLLRDEQFSQKLVLEYFNDNLVQQKLSPTYNSSYLYNYYGANVTFDMRTTKVEVIGHGIMNTMKGTLKSYSTNYQKQTQQSFSEENEYHTLYSQGFLKNFLNYNIIQNTEWTNYRADRSKYQQGYSFGFRLVDLEYILQGYQQNYSKNYLDDIRINCKPFDIQSFLLDQANDQINTRIKWKCLGYLISQQPYPLLLDFDLSLTYTVTFTTNHGFLQVMIKKTYYQKLKFNQVQGFKIVNTKLAQLYIKEVIPTIFGFTVGSNFMVRANSTKVALKQNQGLWVG